MNTSLIQSVCDNLELGWFLWCGLLLIDAGLVIDLMFLLEDRMKRRWISIFSLAGGLAFLFVCVTIAQFIQNLRAERILSLALHPDSCVSYSADFVTVSIPQRGGNLDSLERVRGISIDHSEWRALLKAINKTRVDKGDMYCLDLNRFSSL